MVANWQGEADVVVVGFGAAGAAAAITAHDSGARVVILEKQLKGAHTPSTRMSGGAVMCITGDLERAVGYMDRCAGGLVPLEVTRAWAEKALDIFEWVNRLQPGFRYGLTRGPEFPQFEGSEAVGGASPNATSVDPSVHVSSEQLLSRGAGADLFSAIEHAIAERDIDVRYGSPAQRLLQEDGRVVGVEYRTDLGVHRSQARNGVVLSCGGYEFDEEIKRQYLPAYPVYFYGNPGNTGDGVRMAQSVGAGLWHMNQFMGRGIGRFQHPDGDFLHFLMSLPPPGYVMTDKHGIRYANEFPQAMLSHSFHFRMIPYDPDRGEYPRIPSYWIFDERRRTYGPLTHVALGAVRVGLYDWSPDNSREIEMGWIARGKSVAEVAAAAGIDDPEVAERTVDDYNRGCRDGVDSLGRPPDTLVELDKPPYYCVPLYPGGTNTSGGPRRDHLARVLDPYHNPIPGLFGAGELGQAAGRHYPAAGSSISEALCFGRIAGEQVARRGPASD